MENTADALGLLNCTTNRVSIPANLKKHDNSDDVGPCDNDTFNDNDMYHHHHLHSCGAIFDGAIK